MKKINFPIVGTGLMVLLAASLMITKPLSASLSDTAQYMLGGILITLGLWIFKPFGIPYSAGGLFMAFFALILGLRPATVFSGFTQSAIWTLIPALFFGYTLQKTGLGSRIALGIIKLFKPSYLSLVFAWVMIGIILSALTPSITVRVAIVMPIAVQCCELCSLEKGSKGNSLILLTAFGMALIPGSGWLSGALWGPIISGMINAIPAMENLVTFDSWFSVLFIPMILTTIIMIVGSLILLKPKEKLSADAIDALKTQKSEKMSRQELVAAGVLLAVFLLMLTSRYHGMPDAALCLIAVFALFFFGILESRDFNVSVNWDLVVFVAMALSLGSIFAETGISTWLAGVIMPAIAPISRSPWIFMFAVMVFMFLWRFFDVAILVPTMAIMVPVLPAIMDAYSISPLVWLAIFVMSANCFFMAFQNMWAMLSVSIAGDRAWTSGHLGTYGTIYFVACLLSLIVAIPMWTNAGLFG